jgi:lysozyme
MARAIGCDISLWNGKVDFVKMIAAGASFVFIKASEIQPDPRFQENRKAAQAAGIPWGAYHYINWNSDITAQAVTFCNQLRDDPGQLPPVADFEMKPAPGDARGKLWTFLQTVEKEIGRIPIIYTGYYYWLEHGTPNAEWAKYPLWLAWYASESVIKVPPPWKQWTFWQYKVGGDGPTWGSSGLNIDMDYFAGTVPDLLKYANQTPAHPTTCPTCGQPWPTQAPPPVAPPVVVPPVVTPPAYSIYEVTEGRINIRATPGGDWLRFAVKGDKLRVELPEERKDRYIKTTVGWAWSEYLKKV